MNKDHQDPLQNFKKEAEERLFGDVEFDARLQNRVLQRIQSSPRRRFWHHRFDLGRRWFYGLFVAACIGILYVAGSSLLPDHQPHSPMVAEKDPKSIHSESVVSSGTESPGLFHAPTTGAESEPLPVEGEDLRFADATQGAEWFGAELAEISGLPDSFKLQSIIGSEMPETRNKQITMRYGDDQRWVAVTQTLDEQPEPVEFGRKVDLNGIDGYLFGDDVPRLLWEMDGFQFTITGNITKEEALNHGRVND